MVSCRPWISSSRVKFFLSFVVVFTFYNMATVEESFEGSENAKMVETSLSSSFDDNLWTNKDNLFIPLTTDELRFA